jgi:MoxR-like ATPase
MSLETLISIALLVPMGDPSDPKVRWGLPLLLWGSPGIGKSSRVYAASHAVGLMCEPVYPSTRQPEDFSGVPVPDGNGGVNLACTLGAANTLMQEGKGHGVLFTDEISCARPAVQAAFMSLVLDRRIGDTVLPGGIRILAAANPVEEAAGGWELEPPLANRFAHLDIPVPTSDEWTSWLLNGSGLERPMKIEDGETRVRDGWPDAWAKVSGMMAGFMKALSSHLYSLPPVGHQDRGKAWPSPRSWEFAARAVATIYTLETNKDKRDRLSLDLVAACVGKGAAVAWATWVSKADIPDPLDMLQDGWPIDTKRLDRTIAAYTAMASYVIQRKDKDERIRLGGRGWELLGELIKLGMADLVVHPARSFIKTGLKSDVCPEARPVVLHLGKTPFVKYIEEVA